ncbi:MAG: hypothetical protein Fur0043_23940 [Anaerolineales bacterium]
MIPPRLSVLFVVILCLLGLAGGRVLAYSTPQGLGLNDDSIAYIAGARSILAGQGYREAWLVSNGPVTHFPPGFPAALALLGFLTGLDPLYGARLLNGLLFGSNIFLTGWLGWRMTASRWAGLFAAVMALLSSSLLAIHARAMSEPLYIFLTLLVFLVLEAYFERIRAGLARASLWLAVLGCLLGWAYLARYAALSLLATILAALFVLHTDWRSRWRSAALTLATALPWIVGWSIRNRLVGDSLTNRVLGWHPITIENWELGVQTMAEFFVPFNLLRNRLLAFPGLFEIGLLTLGWILLAWVTHLGWPRFWQPSQVNALPDLPFTNGLYILVYLLALTTTMTLFDPATRFQERILSPTYIPFILLAAALGAWLWKRKQVAWRGAVLALAVGILVMFGYSQARFIQGLRSHGGIFAGEKWFTSEAFTLLRQLPPETLILTNEPGAVYLYTGRPAGVLPREEPGISQIKMPVLEGKIVLVLFRVNKADPTTLDYYYALGRGLYLTDLGNTWIFSAFPKQE